MPSSASRARAAAPADRSGTHDESITPEDVSGLLVEEEFDLGDPLQNTPSRQPRRWVESIASRSSSFDAVSLNDEDDDRDEQFANLTPQRGEPSASASRPREYDAHGLARASGLGILARSPTVRNVSRTLRKASIRVVNIMGNEKDEYEGMTRLPTGDDDDEVPERADSPDEPPDRAPPPPRDPRPPPPAGDDHLRGRTLCMFSASNPIRIAMHRLLHFP